MQRVFEWKTFGGFNLKSRGFIFFFCLEWKFLLFFFLPHGLLHCSVQTFSAQRSFFFTSYLPLLLLFSSFLSFEVLMIYIDFKACCFLYIVLRAPPRDFNEPKKVLHDFFGHINALKFIKTSLCGF